MKNKYFPITVRERLRAERRRDEMWSMIIWLLGCAITGLAFGLSI